MYDLLLGDEQNYSPHVVAHHRETTSTPPSRGWDVYQFALDKELIDGPGESVEVCRQSPHRYDQKPVDFAQGLGTANLSLLYVNLVGEILSKTGRTY